MKSKFLTAFILVFFLPIILSFEYNQNEAWEILKANCPDSYYVVSTLDKIPESYGSSFSKREGIMHWLKKVNPVKYICSFSTGVHECFHAFNASAGKYFYDSEHKEIDNGGTYLCYYINSTKKIIVKKTEVFPSAEMAKQFSLALKLDRFSTYISPSQPDQSTQQDGVYALLDEWNAYYLGMKTLLELIPYVKKNLEPNAENWKEYFYEINSDFIAFVEFKLYIVNYLLYAKTNHSEMYNMIVANKDFVHAYNAVDKAYGDVVDKYIAEKISLIEYLKSNGLNVSEDETAVYFDNDGIGNYVYKHNKMIKEFQKEKYNEIFADLKE